MDRDASVAHFRKTRLIAVLFPGQGTQRIGMGKDLLDVYPELVERASDVLGYAMRALCLHGPRRRFDHPRYTQPAIYVVNALAYMKRQDEGGEPADYFAGHGVGEYNALWAAGAFPFETGLRLVHDRAMSMARSPDDPAALARLFDTTRFGLLTSTVMASATARPYEQSRIAETLAAQLASPRRWIESIRYLLGQGPIDFEEVTSRIVTRLSSRTPDSMERAMHAGQQSPEGGAGCCATGVTLQSSWTPSILTTTRSMRPVPVSTAAGCSSSNSSRTRRSPVR